MAVDYQASPVSIDCDGDRLLKSCVVGVVVGLHQPFPLIVPQGPPKRCQLRRSRIDRAHAAGCHRFIEIIREAFDVNYEAADR